MIAEDCVLLEIPQKAICKVSSFYLSCPKSSCKDPSLPPLALQSKWQGMCHTSQAGSMQCQLLTRTATASFQQRSQKYKAWHPVLTHYYKPAWFWLQQLWLVSFKTGWAFKNNEVLSPASAPHHQMGLWPRSPKTDQAQALGLWAPWLTCGFFQLWTTEILVLLRGFSTKNMVKTQGEAAKGSFVLWALWIFEAWAKFQAMHIKLFIEL